jgi:sporulation protein YlmC with PRC-barrel domain
MAESIISKPSSVGGGKEGEIDDMFSHLELNDDELDDVVIGVEEAKVYHQAARWMAIGKVLTNRSFSSEALFGKMKSVWNLARDPSCREAGENLFIFQMHCLGDWKKVVHQGPWTFRGWGLIIEDYDGISAPEEFVFSGMHVWAQIHGVPELYRKVEVIDDLARRVGKVKEVQMAPKLFFEGNYVRIWVMIDVTKPLMRFVSLSLPEGRKRLAIKYEKVPFFCKHCGLIGHDHEECGDGVWEEKQLQYGSWMLAIRRANQPTPAPRRFTPRAPSRGGWAGRGDEHMLSARKRSSDDASLDDEGDLKSTADSPMKTDPVIGEEEDDPESNARRKLDLGASGIEGNEAVGKTDGGAPSIPPLPPQYVKTKDKKQKRGMEIENPLATLAASFEEDRRA